MSLGSAVQGGYSDFAEAKIQDAVLGGQALGAPATWFLALVTVLGSDATPGTEISTSGTGYARQSLTNNLTNFPAGNPKSNGVAVTFGAFTTFIASIVGWELWDASSAGNRWMWGELLGPPITYTVDPVTDTFTAAAHGLTNGTTVRVRNAGGTLPGGLSASTMYFVIGATTNTFQLSTTLGGSAVDVTSAGDSLNQVAKDFFKSVNNTDTLTFSIGDFVFTLD